MIQVIAAAAIACCIALIMSIDDGIETPSAADARASAHVVATFEAACKRRGGKVVETESGTICRKNVDKPVNP